LLVREDYLAASSDAERRDVVMRVVFDESRGVLTPLCNTSLKKWLGVSKKVTASMKAALSVSHSTEIGATAHGNVGTAAPNAVSAAEKGRWIEHLNTFTRGNAVDTSLRSVDPKQNGFEGRIQSLEFGIWGLGFGRFRVRGVSGGIWGLCFCFLRFGFWIFWVVIFFVITCRV
jgi:hypothetical protein